MHKVCVKLKHGDVPDKMFNKKQLRMGVNVETEHTNDRKVAKMIAKAHLTEFPDYYTHLNKMERDMKLRG